MILVLWIGFFPGVPGSQPSDEENKRENKNGIAIPTKEGHQRSYKKYSGGGEQPAHIKTETCGGCADSRWK
jgi:hypothetical protein